MHNLPLIEYINRRQRTFGSACRIGRAGVSRLNAKPYIVCVPGCAQCLAVVRWIVTHLALEAGMDDRQSGELELAVDEACANIVEHAYRDLDPKPPIHVEICLEQDHVAIHVVHHGEAFDSSAAPLPSFPEHWEEGYERGAGLFLIHHCVDHLHCDTAPDGRPRLRLIKDKKSSPPENSTPNCEKAV